MSLQSFLTPLLQGDSLTLLREDEIKARSSGLISNHETINARTGNPERGGLFCAKTFGPVEENCCLCTKYVGEKYAGITCERCGVLVGSSSLRAERFGHVLLAAPIPHPLFVSQIAAQLSVEQSTWQKILSGDLLAYWSDGALKISSYEEWLSSSREDPPSAGDLFASLAEKITLNASSESGRWLASRGLKISELFLRSLLVLPPALRPIEWVKRPTPIASFDEFFGSLYRSLPPESVAQISMHRGKILTHEPRALGLNHRYQELIKQSDLLATCIKNEAPTLIVQREYAALYHCVHSLFLVGKDSLVKLYLSRQDTDNEEIALTSLSLRATDAGA